MDAATIITWDKESARPRTQQWLSTDWANANIISTVLRFTAEVHGCIDEGVSTAKPMCDHTIGQMDNFLVALHWYFELVQGGYAAALKGARDFCRCDCYQQARTKCCETFVDATWCKVPDRCGPSLQRLLRALRN
jgi:hypothetical protein